MAAGLRAYQQVLADPRARAFTFAGLIARLPISMTGIGIVLLVSLTTGSFGRAGLITGAGTITGALVAPLWGRSMDRMGQARVLITAVIINTVSLTILIISVQAGWPLLSSVIASAGVGLGFSSAGAAVRARWSYRLSASPLLNTAFAFEAMLDEVVFIVGPVLVTFLATSLHPALGIATSGAIGLVGAVALAAQRGTQPPIHPGTRQRGGSHDLPVRILLPVAIACCALGMVFGGMEVVVVAFAKASGVLKYTGVILMAWAFGSLLSGAVTGTMVWKASPAKRFRVGAIGLALSLLPLIFVSNPVGRRPAADAERDRDRADVDRVGSGDPDLRPSEPADRGARLDLDGPGGRRRRRCRRAGPGDRHLGLAGRVHRRRRRRRDVDHLRLLRAVPHPGPPDLRPAGAGLRRGGDQRGRPDRRTAEAMPRRAETRRR